MNVRSNRSLMKIGLLKRIAVVMINLFLAAGTVIGASLFGLGRDGAPSDPVLQKIFSEVEKSLHGGTESQKIDVTNEVVAAFGADVGIADLKDWLGKNEFGFREVDLEVYRGFTEKYASRKKVDVILGSSKTTYAKFITMPAIDRWIVFGFRNRKLIYAIAFMHLTYV